MRGAEQLIGVMDLGFAQWRLDRLGTLTRIDVKLAPGTSGGSRWRNSIALPSGVALTGADTETTRVSNLSRAYRVNLSVLALVALFTGAFLVLSLQAQATIARRSQLAFLRVSGVTAREVQWLLIGEALLLGAAGSVLGLALGAALATLSLQLLGGDLGSGFFSGTQPESRILASLACGVFRAGPGSIDRRKLVACARRRAHLTRPRDEGRRRRRRAQASWPCMARHRDARGRQLAGWGCRRSTAFRYSRT